jgi:hypothetical protein
MCVLFIIIPGAMLFPFPRLFPFYIFHSEQRQQCRYQCKQHDPKKHRDTAKKVSPIFHDRNPLIVLPAFCFLRYKGIRVHRISYLSYQYVPAIRRFGRTCREYQYVILY